MIVVVYRIVIDFCFKKIKFTYDLIVVYVKDSHITCFEPTNDFMFLVEYLNAGNLFIKTSELVNLLEEESFIGA